MIDFLIVAFVIFWFAKKVLKEDTVAKKWSYQRDRGVPRGDRPLSMPNTPRTNSRPMVRAAPDVSAPISAPPAALAQVLPEPPAGAGAAGSRNGPAGWDADGGAPWSSARLASIS